MTVLRRVLHQIVNENDHHGTQLHTAVQQQRGLIMVEGISGSHGHVCPLDEVVRLKTEF